MARLEARAETYFTTVRGMCRHCRQVGPARVFFRDGKVWQQSLCPCGPHEPALIAGDQDWYLANVLQPLPDHAPVPGAHPPRHGCPGDCGPCTWHATRCQLPVLSITNACELKCPICFTYNRPDRAYYMSVAEMRQTVDWVVSAAGRVDLIDITGGEPTLHPQLLDLLRCCRRLEIGRIAMNSNGLRLAKDPDLCARLAELEVGVVLSFNTFEPAVARQMHGKDVVAAKLQALDNLTRAGVRVTLLNVLMRGVNENALSRLLELLHANPQVLSLCIQTMTYTGQGGGCWPVRAHLPVDEAARLVCAHAPGGLRFEDFLPRPGAHPLCYLTCYLLRTPEGWLPLARLAPRERLLALMGDSYLMRLESGGEFFREAINELYAQGATDELRQLRNLLEHLYPRDRELSVFERQCRAESLIRTIYIHAHTDEDTFDCARTMCCPDQVPSEPGRLIPACTYNLFYRRQDDRFYVDSGDSRPPRC